MRTYVGWAAALVAVAFLAGNPAGAGQFKRLNAATLGLGAQIAVHASPQNQGSAMEIDVYEVLSGTASFRCRITQNNTGQQLALRLISLNGSQASLCVTSSAPPFTCNTSFLPSSLLRPNSLYQCTVATAQGVTVIPGSHYTLAVQRWGPFVSPEGSESEEDSNQTDPSGVATSIR